VPPNKILAYLNDMDIDCPFSGDDEFYYKHHDGYMLFDVMKNKLEGKITKSDAEYIKMIESTSSVHGDVEYVVVFDDKHISQYEREYIDYSDTSYTIWVLSYTCEFTIQ
jgi:hypothetical protein